MIKKFLRIVGVESYHISHAERLVSILGAFFGIFFVSIISGYFINGNSAQLLVASMGASAVLLFAVPHGALSQPWALVGGHLISAAVGISCAKIIPNLHIAAPIAVGIAVGAMHYFRCIHPPGGATALSAVVGGSSVTDLGYQFMLTPVLLNVLAILAMAILFNWFFAWRRYPAYLMQLKNKSDESEKGDDSNAIAHEDFVYALSEMDSIIDVSERDLLTIYNLVTQRHEDRQFDPSKLNLGHYYSNGSYGDQWSVRQIIDWGGDADSSDGKLIYKVVAGVDRRSTGVISRKEFSSWARYEVYRDDENWRRLA